MVAWTFERPWRWVGLALVAVGACSEAGLPQSAPPTAGRGGAGEAGDTAAGDGGRGGSGARAGGTSGESGSDGFAGAGESGAAGAANPSGGSHAGGSSPTGAGAGGQGGEVDEEPEPKPIPIIDESALPAPTARAGFVEIAPVTYRTSFGGSIDPRTSAQTRLFYNLLPADEEAKDAPVFVVFNGGPGWATSLLRSFGTGKRTLDPENLAAASVENAVSLTALGNVLYIDCRQAGYSYGLTHNPSSEDERRSISDSQSVNEAFDAADFVRVVLRVLSQNPALKNNPVVIVGESYGGVRASLMLYLLLNARRLSDSTFGYNDTALGSEILAHASDVFLVPAEDLTPQQIAKQFGWQVLLEPLVAGQQQFRRAGSMIGDVRAELAVELGISEDDVQARCPDDVSRTREWCDSVTDATDRVSLDAAEFAAFTGVEPSSVVGLAASERTGAFRFIVEEPATEPDPFGLGPLPAWDRYYLTFVSAGSPGYSFYNGPSVAGAFVYSVNYANTLITNARYDTNIIGTSIVPALRDYMAENPTFGLTRVAYEGDDPDAPSETIRLELVRNAILGRGGTRFVHFPSFPKSGHFVSVSEPERLSTTMAEFLASTGLGE